jgi:CDP-diglyceride synthetase
MISLSIVTTGTPLCSTWSVRQATQLPPHPPFPFSNASTVNLGFMGVVFSFRKQTVKYQIGQVTWTIMTILLVVIQPHFVTRNVYQGLIWLMLPHSMIICNDIMAYFVGIAIGRKFVDRPLTRLSPNKTWEGFVGALILTLVYAMISAEILSNLEYFRCTKAELDNHGGCPPGFLFTPTTVPKILNIDSAWVPDFINSRVFIKPVHLHALVFSLFASLVAPFGGFLASAIKRACIHTLINFPRSQHARKRFLDRFSLPPSPQMPPRISISCSLVTVVLLIVWTASLSWACSSMCTTRPSWPLPIWRAYCRQSSRSLSAISRLS